MIETEITSPGQATESLVAAVRRALGLHARVIAQDFMLLLPEPARATPEEDDLSDIAAARAALANPEPREDYMAVRRELGLDEG